MAIAGVASAIQEALRRRMLDEQDRQAQAHRQWAVERELGLRGRGLDQDASQFDARLGLDRDVLKQRADQFTAEAPEREARTGYLRTQSTHLAGTDARTAAERAHDLALAERQHGYRLGEIGAQGAEARRTAQVKTDAAGNVGGPYAAERNTRTRDAVAKLRGRVGGWTTGAGSMLSSVPGTDARDFAADLNTLKANIAFGELGAMRAASKTGGALGAISEKELTLLESALAGLDQGQSSANFLKNLDAVEQSLARWEAAQQQHGGGATPTAGVAGGPTGSASRVYYDLDGNPVKR